MKKLMFILLLISISALINALCTGIEVVTIEQQVVERGVQAIYPIAVTNNGMTDQLVKISAYCSQGINCFFNPSQPYAMLSPSQNAVFSLNVDTRETIEGNYSIILYATTGSETNACERKELKLQIKAPSRQESIQPFFADISPREGQSGLPGETIEYSILLKNNARQKAYASIYSEGNPFEESTKLSYSFVTLEPREEINLKARITVPAGTPGNVYRWAFVVKTVIGEEKKYFTFPVSIAVISPTLNIRVLNEPINCVSVKNGEKKVVSLILENTGETSGPFQLHLEGSNQVISATSLSTRMLELKSGEKEFINITINPPQKMPAGIHHLYFTAEYMGYTAFKKHYCFNVQNSINVEVITLNYYEIIRGTTSSIPLVARNTGSAVTEYAIEYNPMQENMSIAIQENKFILSPGESKKFYIIAKTDLRTPLGTRELKLMISSNNLTKEYAIPVTVVSSNKSSESFLKINAGEFKAVETDEKIFKIRVSNTKQTILRDVSVRIDGIRQSWYSIDREKDIPPGKSVEYTLIMAPPAGSAGVYSIELIAESGLERVKEKKTLIIEKADSRFDFYIKNVENTLKEGKITEASIDIGIINEGNTRINKVVSSISPEYIVTSNYYYLSLAPRESTEINLKIKPVSETHKKEVPLTLETDRGTLTKIITLPAMGANPFPWKTIAIVLAIVLTAIALIRLGARK